MNKDNVGTLEAFQRLQAAGIVLETEAYWHYFDLTDTWTLELYKVLADDIPAPSMVEIWRELPFLFTINSCICSLMLWMDNREVTAVGYWWHDDILMSCRNTNPTDALIDLLIWVVEQRKQNIGDGYFVPEPEGSILDNEDISGHNLLGG